MIEGYWTALCCIMLFIMLATGWSSWINKHIKLTLLIPMVIIIWLGHMQQWKLDFLLGQGTLVVSGSFLLIALLQFAALFRNAALQIRMVALYAAVLAMSLTLIRALMVISPWAGANISIIGLSIFSGLLLVLLQLQPAEYAAIIYWGAAITEPMLMWQQRGEYSGVIGNMLWWDYVSLAMFFSILFKLLFSFMIKITMNFVHSLGKRMKS